MPTREDADDDDARDAADGGDRGGANSVSRPRVSTAIHHVLQTIVQHAAEAFHDKLKPLSSVLCTLELSGVNWNSNPGVIVAALLRAAGLAWNSTGKKLWRRADPAETIEWRQPAAARGSLRPAAPRATTLGGIGAAAGLQHDPESGSAASARALAGWWTSRRRMGLDDRAHVWHCRSAETTKRYSIPRKSILYRPLGEP